MMFFVATLIGAGLVWGMLSVGIELLMGRRKRREAEKMLEEAWKTFGFGDMSGQELTRLGMANSTAIETKGLSADTRASRIAKQLAMVREDDVSRFLFELPGGREREVWFQAEREARRIREEHEKREARNQSAKKPPPLAPAWRPPLSKEEQERVWGDSAEQEAITSFGTSGQPEEKPMTHSLEWWHWVAGGIVWPAGVWIRPPRRLARSMVAKSWGSVICSPCSELA